MGSGLELEHLLANRLLALDRGVLPSLAQTIRSHGGDEADVQKRFAALGGAPHQGLRNQRSGTVAIIPLVGPITPNPFLNWLSGGTDPDAIAQAMREVRNDAGVTAVLLVVNSPGGVSDLIVETAEEIRKTAAVKPTVAIARTMMCSAAYWLASQCGEIVATPSADVGSIGVYMMHIDASKLNERVGITPTYISAGDHKVEMSEDAPLGADARAFIQRRVDETYASFLQAVARGRNIAVADVVKNFGQGRTFSAAESLRRGMVDRIATLDQTVAKLLTSSGRSSTNARQLAIDEEHVIIAASIQADRDLTASTLALIETRRDTTQAQADRDLVAVARA